jgi:hypothetical protein
MESSKDKEKNIDLIGNEWSLAPNGHEKMTQCQERLLDAHLELNSLGALLCNIGNSELSGDDLFGTGLILRRLSKRISKISDMLSAAIHKK